MSCQVNFYSPIQDRPNYQMMAHEILIAIENETLNVLFLRPIRCAQLIHKAMSEKHLSFFEKMTCRRLYKRISRPRGEQVNWVQEWIIPFFYETIEETEA